MMVRSSRVSWWQCSMSISVVRMNNRWRRFYRRSIRINQERSTSMNFWLPCIRERNYFWRILWLMLSIIMMLIMMDIYRRVSWLRCWRGAIARRLSICLISWTRMGMRRCRRRSFSPIWGIFNEGRHYFQINWFCELCILVLTKLTGIINPVSMHSQSRATKPKRAEESTQNTCEGSSLTKGVLNGSG